MPCIIKQFRDGSNKALDNIFSKIPFTQAGELVKKGVTKIDDTTEKILGSQMRMFTFNKTQEYLITMHEDLRKMQAAANQMAADAMKLTETLQPSEIKNIVRYLDKGNIKLKKDTQDVADILQDRIQVNAGLLVKEGLLKEEYKKENYIAHIRESLVKEYEVNQNFAGLKNVFKRSENSDIEDILAQTTNPSSLIANTLKRQVNQLAIGVTLKNLANNPNIVFKSAEDYLQSQVAKLGRQLNEAEKLELTNAYARPTENMDIVRVPDIEIGGGLKQYGALSGEIMDREAFKNLESLYDFNKAMGGVGDVLNHWQNFITHLKVNTVIKNPASHLYNVASNFLLSAMSGNLGALKNTIKLMATNQEQFKKYVRAFNLEGGNSFLDLTLGFARAEDIQAMGLKAIPYMLQKHMYKDLLKATAKNLYMTADSTTGKFMRDAYDWEDKFFKLSVFIDRIEKGDTPYLAMQEANAIFLDYSKPLPPLMRFLDKSGIMPFMQFTYKTIPATYNVVTKNKENFTRYAMLVSMAQMLDAGYFTSEDDLKPKWANNKLNFMFAAEWAKINDYYMNIGRLTPGFKANYNLEGGGFVGDMIHLISGKTSRGFEITSEHDSTLTKFTKVLMQGLHQFLPFSYEVSGLDMLLGSLIGKEKKNDRKEVMSYGEIVLKNLGFRKFDEDGNLQRLYNSLENRYKEKLKNAKTNEERLEAYRIYKSEKLELDKSYELLLSYGGFMKRKDTSSSSSSINVVGNIGKFKIM